MTTMLKRWFLTVTILAGLLTPSFAIAPKDGQAEALMPAAGRPPFPCTKRGCFSADQPDQVAAGRTRLAVPGQPAGRGNGSTMIVLAPVAEGPVRVVKTLLPTDPRKASRLTVLAGMPDWVWCMLHFCKRG